MLTWNSKMPTKRRLTIVRQTVCPVKEGEVTVQKPVILVEKEEGFGWELQLGTKRQFM